MAHPLKSLAKRGFLPKAVIHAGANRGFEALDYEKAGLEHFIMIEPLAEPFAELEKRCRKIKNATAVQAVLGASDGRKVSFYETSNQGLSSSVLKPEKFLEFHPDKPVVGVHEMYTKTLDTLVPELELNHVTFDCIVADVQGYELDVLMGAQDLLKQTKFLYLECSLLPQYEGSCSLNDLFDFLAPLGFSAVEVEMNNRLMGDVLLIRHDLIAKSRGSWLHRLVSQR